MVFWLFGPPRPRGQEPLRLSRFFADIGPRGPNDPCKRSRMSQSLIHNSGDHLMMAPAQFSSVTVGAWSGSSGSSFLKVPHKGCSHWSVDRPGREREHRFLQRFSHFSCVYVGAAKAQTLFCAMPWRSKTKTKTTYFSNLKLCFGWKSSK